MERSMSIEDKIRRAEKIYYNRRNQDVPSKEHMIKEPVKNRKNLKLLKKMIKQIIICLIIYSVFYAIINNNYIFSADFTNKAREILSQDINFWEIYNTILDAVKKQEDDAEIQTTQNIEQTIDQEKMKEEIQNNDENIGGAEELLVLEETLITEEQYIENTSQNQLTAKKEQTQEMIQNDNKSELSQMEQDANYIKSTINFIKPIEGTISSMFGLRNPTTASVPKNHTGTDIAAIIGTKIISATEGTVIYTSSKGDYGNHLKIQVNDVIILYAHCNKLYVKEGDSIKQGQEIAEVGSTGNTTGPHLHFEVRYQDRYVDPQLILEF